MAQAHRSLLTAVVLLVAVDLARSAPQTRGISSGCCRDDMCINDYRGDGTDVDFCQLKARLVQFCPMMNESCLAAPCEEKSACLESGGYCVSNEMDCPCPPNPWLCNGFNCFCCTAEVIEWPTEEYIEPSVSVCSGDVSLMLGYTYGIHSPNFPQRYDNDINCTMNVVFPGPGILKIEFLYFDLEDCNYDSLSINSGSYVLSGGSLPPAIELFTNSRLTFHSDNNVRATGFYLRLYTVD